MPTGKVKMFSQKGYGFILQDGATHADGVFFHIDNFVGDSEPNKNDRVEFMLRESRRKPGTMEAVDVRFLDQ